MNIFISGSRGFVGKNILKLNTKSDFHCYDRKSNIKINQDFVFHFAGLAHDISGKKNNDLYIRSNTGLTIEIFNEFLKSSAKVFVFLSTIKVLGQYEDIIFEDSIPKHQSIYGLSKFNAEQYLLSKKIPSDKKVYILRSSLIYGEEPKGNLKLLKKYVNFYLPWILSSFDNKISLLDIRNLNFILNKLCENYKNIPSGIYNVSDDNPIKVKELVRYLASARNKRIFFWKIKKSYLSVIFNMGNTLKLPIINNSSFHKLTKNTIVDIGKIKKILNIKLPYTTENSINYYYKK
jgi:nucleoside-diphosphate-sugar epimerase